MRCLHALTGLLFPAAVTLITFESNRRIGANLTGALGNLTPLFAVAIAFMMLGEVPNSGQLAGTVVAPLVACYPLATLAFSRVLLGPGGLTRRIALGVVVTVAGVGVLLGA